MGAWLPRRAVCTAAVMGGAAAGWDGMLGVSHTVIIMLYNTRIYTAEQGEGRHSRQSSCDGTARRLKG